MPSALARHNQGSQGGRKALLKVACLHLSRALHPTSGHQLGKAHFVILLDNTLLLFKESQIGLVPVKNTQRADQHKVTVF